MRRKASERGQEGERLGIPAGDKGEKGSRGKNRKELAEAQEEQVVAPLGADNVKLTQTRT